jgi:hypothetical protein
MNRGGTSRAAPAHGAPPAFSISNQGRVPVIVSANNDAKRVSVPPQAMRSFQLPDNLPKPWKIRVWNQRTGAVIYDGPLKTEAMKAMVINDQGVSFPTRADRYQLHTFKP